MRLRIEEGYDSRQTYTILDYVEREAEGGNWEEGELERIARRGGCNTTLIGRLIETLARKGILMASEVSYIVNGYNRKAVFVEEEVPQRPSPPDTTG